VTPRRTGSQRVRDTLYMKRWRAANPERFRAQQKADRQKNWMVILVAYGAVCACCGEDRRHFLTLDHVNGDGYVARRSGQGGTGERAALAARLRRGLVDDRYQLLCYNCNCARAFAGYCHGEPPGGGPLPPLLLSEVK